MTITLTVPYHDPEGRLHARIKVMMPVLTDLFAQITVNASAVAHEPSIKLFEDVGALIERRLPDLPGQAPAYGKFRRAAVALALQTDSPFIMFGEPDRLFHWIANYPDELTDVVARIAQCDFTVFGRTPRAFATHPITMTRTEGLVNEVFDKVSGNPWDVTSAARGMSRQAAKAIVQGCLDDTIGVDAAWPLFIQQQKTFSMQFIATEGLEYETADIMIQDKAVESQEQWRTKQEMNPQVWAHRLNLARMQMESMQPFADRAL